MIRDVVRYPDPRLKAVCEPVGGDGPLDERHAAIAQDLLDTMGSFPGCVGIAAPQALALSLTRRIRELALGLPGLATWQWLEWHRRRSERVPAGH